MAVAVAAALAAAAAAVADAVGALFAVAELHIAGQHVAAAGTGSVLAVVAADIREAAANPSQHASVPVRNTLNRHTKHDTDFAHGDI